jgi:hypothetical protein
MGISRFVSETPGRDKVDGHLMIDAFWKNDLRGIAIFRLGRCTSFQLAKKIQFVSQFMVPALLGPNVSILEARHTPGNWCNQAVMSGTPFPEKPIKSDD